MLRSKLLAVSTKKVSSSWVLQKRNYNLFKEMDSHQVSHTVFKQSANLQCVIALSELQSRDLVQPRPALGGCRFIEYSNFEVAAKDAIKLSEGMLYKSILAGLELSGGKTVILKPKNLTPERRHIIFQEYGRLLKFINHGETRYITAIDSGTTVHDMDIIRKESNHVASDARFGDPTTYTSAGIFKGIIATVKYVYGSEDLSQLSIAIQGAGGTAYYLARLLHQAGVKKLYVCDVDAVKVKKFSTEFGAEIVKPEDIFAMDVDLISPCALGGSINEENVANLSKRVKIIAGSANNQLADVNIAKIIGEKGITYAPDYVLNAGGLIHCVHSFYKKSAQATEEKLDQIPNTLLEIYKGARDLSIPTGDYANSLANRRIEDYLLSNRCVNERIQQDKRDYMLSWGG